MTATVPRIPDPLVVLRRAEQKHTGEEPGDLDHLADAVRTQIITPLTAGGTPVVDGVQVKQLLADKQRLDDLVAELRKHVETHGKVIAEQKRTIEQQKRDHEAREKLLTAAREADTGDLDAEHERLKKQLSEASQHLAAARNVIKLRDGELAEAREARDTAVGQLRDQGPAPAGALQLAQGDNARLADELAAVQEQLSTTRRNLDLANRTLDEIADEQATTPVAAHVHQYPVLKPGDDPQPCECGKPCPRTEEAHEVVEAEEVHDVEPWGEFFDRMRYELDGEWPK